MECLENIDDTVRAKVLCKVAVSLAQAGLEEAADELVNEIREILDQIELENSRASVLRELAVA